MLKFLFEEENVKLITDYLEWGVTYWTLVNIVLGLTGIACSLLRRGYQFGLFLYSLVLQYVLVFISDLSRDKNTYEELWKLCHNICMVWYYLACLYVMVYTALRFTKFVMGKVLRMRDDQVMPRSTQMPSKFSTFFLIPVWFHLGLLDLSHLMLNDIVGFECIEFRFQNYFLGMPPEEITIRGRRN